MRSLTTLWVAVSIAASLPMNAEEPALESRIKGVEGGLPEFTTPSEMLAGGGDSATRRSLAERMEELKIPGVSIAVIDDFQIAWAKGYGVTQAGGDSLVTPTTLFEAASTTKLVTATIALRLVGEGYLDLDQDVNQVLRSWKIPESDHLRVEKVTLRRLLTHKAGLNRPEGGFSWTGSPTLVETLSGVPPAENAAAVVEIVPGSEWRYSNFGYLVVQLLVEDRMGKPFPQIAQELVVGPLGMRSSTFTESSTPDAKTRIFPHDAEGTTHDPGSHPTAVANGGLITTPTDLAKFTIELMKAYQGRSDRILSRSMTRTMLAKEFDLDPQLLGVEVGEGLGAFLTGEGRSLSFLHPGDNMPGASCWLVGIPETGVGAVIMTNGAKGNLLAMEIIAAITNEYGWPTEQYSSE